MATIVHLGRRLAEVAESIQRLERSLHVSPLSEVVKSAQRQHEFVRSLLRNNKQLADVYDTLWPHLTGCGWYLGLGLPPRQYLKLAKAAREGKDDLIEQFMRHHARSRIEETLKEASTAWPKRTDILRDAFEAHQQGKYTISIPTLLAQADGISHDFLQVYCFCNYDGTPADAVVSRLEGRREVDVYGERFLLGTLADALVNPLRDIESASIRENTSSRANRRANDPKYGPLNRHAVLHGLDVDYPTEANSLRAVLFIDYLIEIKNMLDRRRSSPDP